MPLEVRHRMHFRFDDFIRESQMELRVEPRTTAHQFVQVFHLAVGPPAFVDRYLDWHGNAIHHIAIRDFHDRIEVEARSVVQVSPQPGLDMLSDPPRSTFAELLDFVRLDGSSVSGPGVEALAREIAAPADAPVREQVEAVGQLVTERIRYVPGVTDWRSTSDEALEAGSGVCQDFAHVSLGLLRLRGIPARYVSGYLHLGETAEPAQSHAWIEVYGTQGWVGYDPTHQATPDERYVWVASGRDYHDVPPNRGFYRGTAEEKLEATVETRSVEPRDIASLQRASADIEVPVYTELPNLTRARLPGAEEQPPDPTAQQQQQQ